MRSLMSLAAVLFASVGFSQPPVEDAAIERMRKDLFFLAGPECEGRGVGTAGLDRAADHLAATFKAAGLEPAMGDNSYFQSFSISNFPELEGKSTLDFSGPDGKAIRGWEIKDWGRMADANLKIADAKCDNYDCLVIPGGVINPDKLRIDEDAMRVVREFLASGKIVAAVCHGPWLLVQADACRLAGAFLGRHTRHRHDGSLQTALQLVVMMCQIVR